MPHSVSASGVFTSSVQLPTVSPVADPTIPSSGVNFPLQDHEIGTASVDDLVAACEKAPQITETGTCIKRISENTVVKLSEFVCLSEARNMQFVAAKTSVRVPRVFRAFEVPIDAGSKTTYIVMEYIRGEVLRDCWERMSDLRRQSVCSQVVNAITELQSLHVEQSGPIGGGRSRGPWFSLYGAGPFRSVDDLEAWFTHKLEVCKRMKKVRSDAEAFNGKFGKMVMCHMDISPRNIVVEKGDRICLIDWDFAGAYPKHFERAGIMRQGDFEDFNQVVLERLPAYEREVKALYSVMYGLTTGSMM